MGGSPCLGCFVSGALFGGSVVELAWMRSRVRQPVLHSFRTEGIKIIELLAVHLEIVVKAACYYGFFSD